MMIEFKSIPEHYKKEIAGKKMNTVRILDYNDVRATAKEGDLIVIRNKFTGEIFERKLTDVTQFDFLGKLLTIYSWNEG